MTDLNITLAKFAIQANVKERKKKILMAQFGSLFKLHTCADHKKSPVKAQPGKPQQLVYFYKHAHIKHREAHKFTCAITPSVCAHYSPLIVLQYVAIRWVQPDCRRKWSSSSWWHCEVSAQSWAGWSSPTLRVSRKKKKWIVVRKTLKLPGACQCHVFTALVNMLVLGNSRAARVSAEGVQQRGAAISHVKHILLTGTHYITSNDIILYSNWWSTLLFKKKTKTKKTSILTRSRLLETFFFFHGTAELSHTCFDSQTSTNT